MVMDTLIMLESEEKESSSGGDGGEAEFPSSMAGNTHGSKEKRT